LRKQLLPFLTARFFQLRIHVRQLRLHLLDAVGVVGKSLGNPVLLLVRRRWLVRTGGVANGFIFGIYAESGLGGGRLEGKLQCLRGRTAGVFQIQHITRLSGGYVQSDQVTVPADSGVQMVENGVAIDQRGLSRPGCCPCRRHEQSNCENK
jgi:hypothetical protein